MNPNKSCAWRGRFSNGILLGMVLVGIGIGIGIGIKLNQLGCFNFDPHIVVPLLAIDVGGVMVFLSFTARHTLESLMRVGDGSDAVVQVTAVLGGFERRVISHHFRGGAVTAVMGGCGLDLRKSSIDGEAVINVFAAMGGITLKVPPDWTVILSGTAIMGGFVEKTSAPANDGKRLIIKGYAVMGGVEVHT